MSTLPLAIPEYSSFALVLIFYEFRRLCNSGCISLLLPKLSKLSCQCYSNRLSNLGNLSNNKDIQSHTLDLGAYPCRSHLPWKNSACSIQRQYTPLTQFFLHSYWCPPKISAYVTLKLYVLGNSCMHKCCIKTFQGYVSYTHFTAGVLRLLMWRWFWS